MLHDWKCYFTRGVVFTYCDKCHVELVPVCELGDKRGYFRWKYGGRLIEEIIYKGMVYETFLNTGKQSNIFSTDKGLSR